MARTIEIISTESKAHHLLFGFDNSELATFSIQMYIVKTGSRAVDWLQSLSLGFCSYMGGNIYLHNSDEVDRCTLFGEKKDCKVGVMVNDQPNVNKILDSLGIDTDNDEWEVESIVIAPNENYPQGQCSVIPTGKFQKREGMLYSEFMRNQKTSSSTISYIEAITGEELRGRTAFLILKNTARTKVSLFSVDVLMTKSR